ncbi:MAG: hypothetical protein PHC28_12125 [Flavobacterium sp.]|uniref:hypothetical protein n=1 Tax=Flavobacterium sp. TaxID=239 RepID=UPI0026281B47|nr:hypothetical protein [Flavobacterium sp.]MDD5151200.1 hypothetical protein [Flavobacterium sp.]
MKTHISLLILSFFSITVLTAQEKSKDTIFFNVDRYYTLSPTMTPNLSNQTYSDKIELDKQRMIHTKTNGYIFFVGDGFLTKGLKPKQILSIKDYIENRKFYFDGKYNQIIDQWKLKDSLTDKYTIYFVNGNEFIHPKFLEYHSYYPIGKGENVITNKIKDTLFFKQDKSYVFESKYEPNSFLLKDSKGNEIFYFRGIELVKNLKPNEILCLKKTIRSSRFYDKNKVQKLNNYKLGIYFNNYVIFLVKKKNNVTEYIRVEPTEVIYD